ncbi:MAG: hypothetical protein ABJB33_03060, partial [Gemmatimonadota bacterium]
ALGPLRSEVGMNGRIFRVTLAAQARYVAPFLALAVLIAVALPLATLQGMNASEVFQLDRAGLVLAQSRTLAGGYPILALCLGLFLAVATWLPDIHQRWAYVLTLPVARSRIALIRVVAGITLLVPVALALWIAGMLAARVADLPDVVRAYPGALTLRFLAGGAVAFAAGSLVVLAGKRLWIIPVAIGLLLLLQTAGLPIWSNVIDALFLHPLGPFHPLAGQWLLFDV